MAVMMYIVPKNCYETTILWFLSHFLKVFKRVISNCYKAATLFTKKDRNNGFLNQWAFQIISRWKPIPLNSDQLLSKRVSWD